MSEIRGLEGLSAADIARELDRGARFVSFDYVISIVLMTFRRSSAVHFVTAQEGTLGKSLPFTLLTLLLGWWGIPWGPIYTVGALTKNLRGGRDVTQEVLAHLNTSLPGDAAPTARRTDADGRSR